MPFIHRQPYTQACILKATHLFYFSQNKSSSLSVSLNIRSDTYTHTRPTILMTMLRIYSQHVPHRTKPNSIPFSATSGRYRGRYRLQNFGKKIDKLYRYIFHFPYGCCWHWPTFIMYYQRKRNTLRNIIEPRNSMYQITGYLHFITINLFIIFALMSIKFQFVYIRTCRFISILLKGSVFVVLHRDYRDTNSLRSGNSCVLLMAFDARWPYGAQNQCDIHTETYALEIQAMHYKCIIQEANTFRLGI